MAEQERPSEEEISPTLIINISSTEEPNRYNVRVEAHGFYYPQSIAELKSLLRGTISTPDEKPEEENNHFAHLNGTNDMTNAPRKADSPPDQA